MDYNAPWRHVRHGKAQRHYEQVAEQARLTRVANDEADRVAAEERLHAHGIEVTPYCLESVHTAAQLRALADKLDPLPPIEDGPMVVKVEVWDDGLDGPAVLACRREQPMPTVGDGVFNVPVFVHAEGRRDFSLSLRLRRIS